MPVWTEVQAGDMQREQENAYFFRRCGMKDDWAMLATQIGNPGPETPDFKFECYARDPDDVEFYTMELSRAEWDALVREDVGKTTEPQPEPEPDPVLWVLNDDAQMSWLHRDSGVDTWVFTVGEATLFTEEEKAAVELPIVDHENAQWVEHTPA